jgi:hypothetical protein
VPKLKDVAPRELIEALKVVLDFAQKPVPSSLDGSFDTLQLLEIMEYVKGLLKLTSDDSKARQAADRAVARSNRAKLDGKDHWAQLSADNAKLLDEDRWIEGDTP